MGAAQRIVVVGASLSGVRVVQALRRRGSTASLVLVGDEIHPPYDRPPLSKDVLTGAKAPETTHLVRPDELAALDVDMRIGRPATGVDLAARLLLLDSDEIAYDRLVIATGSSARTLPAASGTSGVFTLRTLDDAQRLGAALRSARRVVVVGGGFVGCEVAAVARDGGADVAIIDPMPVLMRRGLGDEVGARMTRRHAAHGVELYLGRTPARFQAGAAGRIAGVALDDGTEVAADLVLVGIGATPNTAWLADSGLTIDDGVVCDGTLCAAPDVYAVGDVARWYHPRYGSIRLEHWTGATEHANAVAATLTGTPTVVASVPYVWTDQFGVRLQIAGRVEQATEFEVVLDEPDRFLVRARAADTVLGVAALGAPREFVRERMALAQIVAA